MYSLVLFYFLYLLDAFKSSLFISKLVESLFIWLRISASFIGLNIGLSTACLIIGSTIVLFIDSYGGGARDGFSFLPVTLIDQMMNYLYIKNKEQLQYL